MTKSYTPYTKESLARLNAVYLSEYGHRITEADIECANDFVERMYQQLKTPNVCVGDRVKYVTKYGDWYPNAHVDRIEGDTVVLCLSPFVPFIYRRDDGIAMYSVSGGPWVSVPIKDLAPSVAERKTFQFFGSAGICAHGAIQFKGFAKCWTYKEDGLLFGEYTTQLFDRTVFRKTDGKWYLSDTTNTEALPRPEEFQRWMRELHGKQFGSFETDDVVTVFTYKELHRLMSEEEWLKLDLPLSDRRINGTVPVPVKLDACNFTNTVIVYRYKNN